jgi:hypothetical protein
MILFVNREINFEIGMFGLKFVNGGDAGETSANANYSQAADFVDVLISDSVRHDLV